MAVNARPVHLYSIAGKFGVSEIRNVAILEDGRLRRDHGRIVIELRADRNPQRRRFTLAHELAHLLLDSTAGQYVTIRARSASARHAEVERLCDSIAAALLMPPSVVEELEQSYGVTFGLVEALATITRCSLGAAATRVCEITDTPVVLTEVSRSRTGDIELRPLSRRPRHLSGNVRIDSDQAALTAARINLDPRPAQFRIGSRQLHGRIEIRSSGPRRFVFFAVDNEAQGPRVANGDKSDLAAD